MKIPTEVPEKGFYYHYKHDPANGLNDYAYEILGTGVDTEGEASLVVYRPLYKTSPVYQQGKLFWLRPLKMFVENVTKDGKIFSRFTKITDGKTIKELEAIKRKMYGNE